MEEYPLFTVIIPQKDRAEYLIHTLRTCMIQDYPNCEFIVADDCSEDNSVDVVRELQKKDPRIKLIAHEKHVGMRDNFENALTAVRPGYVMALGGDDGLTPGCFWKMLKLIRETGRQLITWRAAHFVYPDKEGGKNKFILSRKKQNGYKILKSEDFLNKIARTFYYMIDECPMFYIKGVVSTELVNRVKSRTADGCFYYCPTPDGFSGVVLCGEVEDYVYTQEPLSITGMTFKSQGHSYKRTDAESKKAAQEFFNDNIRRTMHKELASQQYSPLITLMTADYLLTARDLPGWPGKFKMFKFDDLIKATFQMLVKNPFDNEVLVRELKILREIARQHDMLDLFNDLLKNTKRKVVRTDVFDGLVITPKSVMYEGASLGIENIFDAAIATPFAFHQYQRISFKGAIHVLKRMLRTLKNGFNYKVEYLPSINDDEE
ncbi:MAG: glycosyltransferase family 2 protein [Bacteroidales bacterium]|nr:glycosyltransferase family 2 protein [Bacteroidales bacterium]